MKIIQYFKKLKKKRELKKAEKGIIKMAGLLDEMVAEGRITNEEAIAKMTTMIWVYLLELDKLA